MTAETTTPSRIMVEFTPPVARIRLQHPPVNVIDVEMMEELATALATISSPRVKGASTAVPVIVN